MSHPTITVLSSLNQAQTEQLSQLLALPFAYYRQASSPFITDFIRHLRTLAGLSLTACLADDFWYPCQTYFNEFIQAGRGQFRDDPGTPELWGSRMAHLVQYALESFRRLSYPPYYADFLEALQGALKRIPLDQSDKRQEAEKLLHLFPQPPRPVRYL